MFVLGVLHMVVGSLFAFISHSTAALLLLFCSVVKGLHLQQLSATASQTSPGIGCSLSELLWF